MERRPHRNERLEERAPRRGVVGEADPRRRTLKDADPVATEEVRQRPHAGQRPEQRTDRPVDDPLRIAGNEHPRVRERQGNVHRTWTEPHGGPAGPAMHARDLARQARQAGAALEGPEEHSLVARDGGPELARLRKGPIERGARVSGDLVRAALARAKDAHAHRHPNAAIMGHPWRYTVRKDRSPCASSSRPSSTRRTRETTTETPGSSGGVPASSLGSPAPSSSSSGRNPASRPFPPRAARTRKKSSRSPYASTRRHVRPARPTRPRPTEGYPQCERSRSRWPRLSRRRPSPEKRPPRRPGSTVA